MTPEPPGSTAEIRPGARAEWIENSPSRGWLSGIDPTELLAFRELAWLLALRDLKVRYKQTFFGVAWAVIQPLAGVAIFTVVFGHLADVPSDGLPYAVFAYAGLVVWTYISTSVNGAAESLAQQEALVTKVYFPRLLAPMAAVLPALVDLLISLVVLAIFIAIDGVEPTIALVLLPLWIAAAAAVAAAFGVLLCALNVEYRDVRYALPFALQIWLFASPVIYPSSLFHGLGRALYSLNPVVGVIDCFRWSAAAGPPPVTADLVSLASLLVITVGGLAYFGRVERRFADRI